jgi:tetratricopeptide (TPR) repeat protein
VHAGFLGDRAEAERLVADVRRRNEAYRNPVVEPQMLSTLGDLAYREGNLEEARDMYVRSVNEARANGFLLWQLWQGAALTEVELRLGRLDDAARSAEAALRIARQLHDRDHTLWQLSLLAVTALRQGDRERAGLLWGATSAEERDRPPVRVWEELDELRAPLVESTDPVFLESVEHGELYALDDAVALALGEAQTVP